MWRRRHGIIQTMAGEQLPKDETEKHELWLRVRYARSGEVEYQEVRAPVVWANRRFVEVQLPEEASGYRVQFGRKSGRTSQLFSHWSFSVVQEDLKLLPLGTLRKTAPKLERVEFKEPCPTLLVSCKHRTEDDFRKMRWELLRLEGHSVVLRRPDEFGGGEVVFAKDDGTTDNLGRDDGWYFALHILERTTLAFLKTGLADFNERWNYRHEKHPADMVCLRFQEQLGKGVALEGEVQVNVLKRTRTTLTLCLPDGTGKTFSRKTGLEQKRSKGATVRWAVVLEEQLFG
jgi:hypothetical protein